MASTAGECAGEIIAKNHAGRTPDVTTNSAPQPPSSVEQSVRIAKKVGTAFLNGNQ
jgi:hypothetical protein